MEFGVMNLAAIFGPMLVIISVWSLFCCDHVQQLINSVKTTPAMLYVGAVINLLVGLTTVNIVPWQWDKTLFVTLFGWLLIVRALFVLFLPAQLIKWTLGGKCPHRLFSVTFLIWGGILCFLAFS